MPDSMPAPLFGRGCESGIDLNGGGAVDALEPIGLALVFEVVVDFVAGLGEGAVRDFFGTQEIVAVGLLERLAYFALLQIEDDRTEGVGDVIRVVQGGEVAGLFAGGFIVGVLL